ncbi:hypothetical protein DUI87_12159 [Hirundo rustica rustica]|uniref:Uncharacterized protein n=1 Tax=Hirundo rustica rustica TaxID=333673 RepID=A0A3M0KCN3_HIRRU|nr:hypothetical protein DUI87_12159 [Hirundo rustica rustica]
MEVDGEENGEEEMEVDVEEERDEDMEVDGEEAGEEEMEVDEEDDKEEAIEVDIEIDPQRDTEVDGEEAGEEEMGGGCGRVHEDMDTDEKMKRRLWSWDEDPCQQQHWFPGLESLEELVQPLQDWGYLCTPGSH